MYSYCKTCSHDDGDIGFCDKCYYNHILEQKGIPPTEYKAKPKPKTNADIVRSMSDEELAKWFGTHACCMVDPFFCSKTGGSCKACWLDWLKQDAPHDQP